jgi:hypothetical protein
MAKMVIATTTVRVAMTMAWHFTFHRDIGGVWLLCDNIEQIKPIDSAYF